MATTKDYRDYVLDCLSLLNDVTCMPMMGEYLLYYKDVLFGGIYDDRFLVKKTPSNDSFKLDDAIPYPHGKPMYLVENLDDREFVRDIVLNAYSDLK